MDLNLILNDGIKTIARTLKRFYLKNKEGRTFMLNIARAVRDDMEIRERYEAEGTHIPPFLIASIASECNLHCAGCYSRSNGSCGTLGLEEQMSTLDWERIFNEASMIGVSFILLAGGEPLLKKDVVEIAAKTKDIIFPIFTNGTMIDEEYILFFNKHRNMIPVLSIEGSAEQTDARRGKGMSQVLDNATSRLRSKGILYGASITVTTENYAAVTEQSYIKSLQDKGCGIVFYVEYVPVEKGTENLVLNDVQLLNLQSRISALRKDKKNKHTTILSFPGDEGSLGGCLAAGRGFFHISSKGFAEPCPFSPYATIDLKQQTILDALRSPFFEKIRAISAAEALNHNGGCTLYQHEDEVIKTLNGLNQKQN